MAKASTTSTRASSTDESAAGFAAMTDWSTQFQRMQSDAMNGWQQALAAQSRLASGWIELQSELTRNAQQQAQAMVDAWWGGIPAMEAREARAATPAAVEAGTPAAMVEQARALWDGLVFQLTGGVPLDG